MVLDKIGLGSSIYREAENKLDILLTKPLFSVINYCGNTLFRLVSQHSAE